MGSAWIASSPATFWSNSLLFTGVKSVKGLTSLGFISIRIANCQRQTNASPSLSENTPGNIMSRMSQSSDRHQWVLLTTCQAQLRASYGSTTNAGVLSDSVWYACLVTEWLTRHLHLPCQYSRTQIGGIGGIMAHSGSHEVVNFKVSPTCINNCMSSYTACVCVPSAKFQLHSKDYPWPGE